MFAFITSWIEQGGVFGVALLMFLENVFPPIPSELIMPLAGFLAAQGRMSLGAVLAAGLVGTLAGALFWYAVGRAIGLSRVRSFAARHGRWLTLRPSDVDRAQAWFDRRGAVAVFVGRLVPTIRTLVSIPAGIARMPLGAFLAWTALGSFLWTAFLTLSGYLLEAGYHRVEAWVDPLSKVVVAVVVVVYLWRLVTWRGD